MKVYIAFVLFLLIPSACFVYADAVPQLTQESNIHTVVEKRFISMQYVFNYAQAAAGAQALRPVKFNIRKAKTHLKAILEETEAPDISLQDAAAVEAQIKNNRITLAAQEIEPLIDKVLTARKVPDARAYAKKAMQKAREIAFPEAHSLVDVDLDYDNIFRSY